MVNSITHEYPGPVGGPDLSSGEEAIIVVPDILYGNDSSRRTKILMIDAELSNLQFLERILRRVRIESLKSTTDSRTALSLFQEFRPDLVLILHDQDLCILYYCRLQRREILYYQGYCSPSNV